MTALASSRAPLDNDDVEPLGLSLLELEEEETTDHVIGDLTITLRGYPRSSGQTLQCTGETTWRGGDLLARHLWRRRATTATAPSRSASCSHAAAARWSFCLKSPRALAAPPPRARRNSPDLTAASSTRAALAVYETPAQA